MNAHYVIQPRPPLRTWAIADGAAVIGALLAVGTAEFGWPPAMLWVGVLLIAGGVALLVAALVTGRRRRVTVELDDGGYRVRDASGEQAGPWSSVARLTGARGQLTLHESDRPLLRLVAPPGAEPTLEAIAREMSRRLDADRGYRTLP